jgi:hypothetical protein
MLVQYIVDGCKWALKLGARREENFIQYSFLDMK